jgi:hypothetical protein
VLLLFIPNVFLSVKTEDTESSTYPLMSLTEEVLAWRYRRHDYRVDLDCGHVLCWTLDESLAWGSTCTLARANGSLYSLTPCNHAVIIVCGTNFKDGFFGCRNAARQYTDWQQDPSWIQYSTDTPLAPPTLQVRYLKSWSTHDANDTKVNWLKTKQRPGKTRNVIHIWPGEDERARQPWRAPWPRSNQVSQDPKGASSGKRSTKVSTRRISLAGNSVVTSFE